MTEPFSSQSEAAVRVGLIQQHVDAEPDDHVFIVIRRTGRPTVSLDLANVHGRGYLSVRVNGMGMGGHLVDVEHLPPAGSALHRFCPFCGEEINLVSSKSHRCDA